MPGNYNPPYSARTTERMTKKQRKVSNNYQTNPKHNEKLKKVLAEIDSSLPTYFTPVWKTSEARSWDETPTAKQTCHFFRLPPELRIVVYANVLKKPYTINLLQRNWDLELRLPSSAGPALVQVSRDIRHEALPVYFQVNKFMLQTALGALSHTASWLERITLLSGSQAFRGLRLQVHHCRWTEFSRVQRLVELLASGKVKLDVSRIDLSSPVPKQGSNQRKRLFVVDDRYGGMNVQRALEEAVLLGTTAYEQRWSARKLASQFEVLTVLKLPLAQLAVHKQTVKRTKRKEGHSKSHGAKRGSMKS